MYNMEMDFGIKSEKEILETPVKTKTKIKKKKITNRTDFQIATQDENEFGEISIEQETKSARKKKYAPDGTDYVVIKQERDEVPESPFKMKAKSLRKQKPVADGDADFQMATTEVMEFTSLLEKTSKSSRKNRSPIEGTNFAEIKQEGREFHETPLKTKTKSARKRKTADDETDAELVRNEIEVTESSFENLRKRKLSIDGPDLEKVKDENDIAEDSLRRKTKKKKQIYGTGVDNDWDEMGEMQTFECPIKQKTKKKKKLTADVFAADEEIKADIIDDETVKDVEVELTISTVKKTTKTPQKKKTKADGAHAKTLEDTNEMTESLATAEAKTPRKHKIKAEAADVEAFEDGGNEMAESPATAKAISPHKQEIQAEVAHVKALEDGSNEWAESPVTAKAKSPRKRKIQAEVAHVKALEDGSNEWAESPAKAKAKSPRKKKFQAAVSDVEAEETNNEVTERTATAKAKSPRKRKIQAEVAHVKALEDGSNEWSESPATAKAKSPRKKRFQAEVSDVEAEETNNEVTERTAAAKAKSPRKKKMKVADSAAFGDGSAEITESSATPRKKEIKAEVADVEALEYDNEMTEIPVKAKAKRPRKKKMKTDGDDNKVLEDGENGITESPVKRKTQTPRKRKITAKGADVRALKEGETGTTDGPVKCKRKTTTPRKSTINGNDFETAYQALDLENISIDEYGKFQKYNKDKPWKMLQFPHHLTPAFNLTRKPEVNEMRDFPLLNVSAPHSVYVRGQHLNSVDICHRRTVALSLCMNRLKQIRGAYMSVKKNSKQVRKNEKNGIYNKALIEYARRRESNPDKYFCRDYDFYYTGGNLCVNPVINNVLHANGNNMESLTLSVFNVQNNLPVIEEVANVNFNDTDIDSSEIFEVKFDRSACNTFFMRRKFCVSMHQYRDDNFYTLKKFNSKKKVPFISFAQDKFNTNHLAVSNLEHVLRVYDLETGHRLSSFKLWERKKIKPATNWNQIISLDAHVYIYAACRKFNLIDVRVPESEWQSNYSGFTDEDYCANFSSLALSDFQNLFYIGSNHKVHCVDIRRIESNIGGKYSSVVNWTHQMASCPLMIATNGYDDCEFIALQSPLSADLRICENIQSLKESYDYQSPQNNGIDPDSEYVYNSHCLPYMPKSLESVYHEARMYGRCLNPNTGLVDRVKACTTGLSFVGDSSNPYILTLTSNGDLFARHMFESADADIKTGIECSAEVMTRYEERVNCLLNRPRLNITEMCNLSGLSKVFRCPALSEVEPADDIDNKYKRRRMGRWQKSLQTLQKFQDALAKDLLSIWDIEEENIKDINLTSLTKNSASDPKHYVSSWLNTTQQNANSTMVSIGMDSFNANCSALETQLDDQIENNDTQMELPPPITISKAKVSKQKKSYVKGF